MRCVASSDISLDPTAGDATVIRGIAADLKRESAEKTLAAIHSYLDRSMTTIENATWDHPSRRPMTSVEILRGGAWGCSAYAQVACHFARACGIPAILAKSLDIDWIERGNQGDGRGKGHVYVEVLIAGKPCLWDAQGGELHKDYDPESGLVPGARRIYDKGGADALVLSHHGENWEAETKRLFPRAEKR